MKPNKNDIDRLLYDWAIENSHPLRYDELELLSNQILVLFDD